MKIFISLFTLFTATVWASNSHALSADQAVRNCIANWGKTPFNARHPRYTVLKAKSKVSILNRGGGKITDTKATRHAKLMLVEPGVSVLSNTHLTLTNPNGWYCLHNNVNVLTKMYVTLGCKSHIASSREGVNVLVRNEEGKDEQNLGSVNVLTKTFVTRKCK